MKDILVLFTFCLFTIGLLNAQPKINHDENRNDRLVFTKSSDDSDFNTQNPHSSFSSNSIKNVILEDSSYEYVWDYEKNTWDGQPPFRYIKIYDQKLRLIRSQQLFTNPVSGRQEKLSDCVYRYDKGFNLLSSMSTWKEMFSEIEKPADCDTFTYKNNVLVLHKSYKYNSNDNRWEISEISRYSKTGRQTGNETMFYGTVMPGNKFKPIDGSRYSSKSCKTKQSNLTRGESYSYRTDTWNKSYQTEYFYSNDNLLIRSVYSDWDSISSTYLNRNQFVFSYKNGLNTETISRKWDGSKWVDSNKIMFEYDSVGHVICQSSFQWDGIEFSTSGRQVFHYNSSRELIESLGQTFKDSTWYTYQSQILSYDDNFNLLTKTDLSTDIATGKIEYGTIIRYTYGPDHRLMQTLNQQYDTQKEQFVNTRKKIYYYSEHEIMLRARKVQLPLMVYPDPATFSIYFTNIPRASRVEIYDELGYLKLNVPIRNNHVDIRKLYAGQYTLKVIDKQSVNTCSFLVNKPLLGGAYWNVNYDD